MHAMTPQLVDYLCDPVDKSDLRLEVFEARADGGIVQGELVSAVGRRYSIRDGIPRFIETNEESASVTSFGDEWNHFNFVEFKAHWLEHTVKNTFGSAAVFGDKLVVDAGCGSGAQTLWALQSGARHVIALELSHSVDDVVRRNLEPSGFQNYDVVQCSIDAPPLRDRCIDGIVICHNVIQHTPSVEKTAAALFALVGPAGEFVFNCYPKNDRGLLRWVRFHVVYEPLRRILSNTSFRTVNAYATAAAIVRQLPALGLLLEKSGACVMGEVVFDPNDSRFERLRKRYRATALNTFDCFGTHAFQHHKTDDEIRALVTSLQPDATKVKNLDAYFSRPAPIGCALRLFR